MQRFNAEGTPLWEPEGRMMLDSTWPGQWPMLLSPGRLMLIGDHEIPPGTRDYFLFLRDTSNADQWEPQGRFADSVVGQGSDFQTYPDGQGGYLAMSVDSFVHQVRRYDGAGNLLATSALGAWINLPDGLGGGWRWNYDTDPQADSGRFWASRLLPDLTPLRPDSTPVIIKARGLNSVRQVTDGSGGFLGMTSLGTELAFFHVNVDGTLGPRLSAGTPHSALPQDFRILAAYPNPFNGSTRLRLSAPRQTPAQLVVYDILGRLLNTGPVKVLTAGESDWIWTPAALASGTYYVKLQTLNGAKEALSPTVRLIYIK